MVKKATSRDVARLAGVSQTTVSYVMSGRRSVAPDTERKVMAAMAELGYQPHSGARALKSNRTNVIGLVVPYRSGADAAAQHRFLVAFTSEVRRYAYDILLVTTDEGVSGLRRVIDTALCDALLLMEVLDADPRVELVAQSQIPTVFVGLPGPSKGVYAVDADYVEAGRQAVRVLVKARHEHLTLVMPDHPTLSRLNFLERFRAGAVSEANAQNVPLSVIGCSASYPSAFQTAHSLGELPDEGVILGPLVSADDWSNALNDCGHRLGREVSLVASSWDAEHAHSAFSPAHFDMRTPDLVRSAVELMMLQLERPAEAEPQTLVLPPIFYEGDTLRKVLP
ncbi:LacI family DNA-binding transcriptional regulator [Schaalia sp. Marseille-Q2122]|uniref:LacI family DNA-binding transcriptional regulator n=1 Tax=Schaalia sp. Marseille-Q2122 TaxID=2736604 RepID=UPI00158B8938|nr:LacI family DNA-binding transcriptional regulator [Schaalia sp. Marseille-Q2122]